MCCKGSYERVCCVVIVTKISAHRCLAGEFEECSHVIGGKVRGDSRGTGEVYVKSLLTRRIWEGLPGSATFAPRLISYWLTEFGGEYLPR